MGTCAVTELNIANLTRRKALGLGGIAAAASYLGLGQIGIAQDSKRAKAGKRPKATPPVLGVSGDFPGEFRAAYHRPVRDPGDEALLQFFTVDLPPLVRSAFDDSNVWIEYNDVASPLTDCRTLEVGEVSQPKQSRTHKHSNTDYRFETRSVKTVAYIDFCHPSINDIWEDVRGCAIGAAVSAVVAAILAKNYAVAEATFYPVFYACLVSRIGDRAREVAVSYRSDTEYGCWENHCAFASIAPGRKGKKNKDESSQEACCGAEEN